jgi:hypothetical protein
VSGPSPTRANRQSGCDFGAGVLATEVGMGAWVVLGSVDVMSTGVVAIREAFFLVLRRVNAAALVRAAGVGIEDLTQDELTDSARGPRIPAAALADWRSRRPAVRSCTRCAMHYSSR